MIKAMMIMTGILVGTFIFCLSIQEIVPGYIGLILSVLMGIDGLIWICIEGPTDEN